jgi:hypothetical protein
MSYPARLDRLWVLGLKQRELDTNYLHVVAKLSILGGILPFSLLRILQTGSWGLYSVLFNGYRGSFLRGKAAGA